MADALHSTLASLFSSHLSLATMRFILAAMYSNENEPKIEKRRARAAAAGKRIECV